MDEYIGVSICAGRAGGVAEIWIVDRETIGGIAEVRKAGRVTLRSQVLYPDSVADADLIIPGKRKPDLTAEWRLQGRCVRILRKECRINKDLRFLAPMPERKRDAKQAAIAKMMGLQSGPPDIWLFLRTHPGCKIWLVELKKPGKPLTNEQKDWFEWSPWQCYRVDNLADFAQVLVRFLG